MLDIDEAYSHESFFFHRYEMIQRNTHTHTSNNKWGNIYTKKPQPNGFITTDNLSAGNLNATELSRSGVLYVCLDRHFGGYVSRFKD